jgi:hypothetical protein
MTQFSLEAHFAGTGNSEMTTAVERMMSDRS